MARTLQNTFAETESPSLGLEMMNYGIQQLCEETHDRRGYKWPFVTTLGLTLALSIMLWSAIILVGRTFF